jgi:hypothetical protein
MIAACSQLLHRYDAAPDLASQAAHSKDGTIKGK